MGAMSAIRELSATRRGAAAPIGGSSGSTASGAGQRVLLVHRAGAIVVALVIAVFGVLGLANGLDFFSTQGEQVAGLSSNGLLSIISLATATVLVVSALRGPRLASNVMTVVGALFLVSALANLAVLNTSFNFLAFRMPNVIFSIVAGLVLLTLGAYGRVSGHLPPDNPYVQGRPGAEDLDPETELPEAPPESPAERAAERAMREAEIAVVQHTATEDQRRRVEAMRSARTRAERREVWMSFDRQPRPQEQPEEDRRESRLWSLSRR
jgi:hypothetical protein